MRRGLLTSVTTAALFSSVLLVAPAGQAQQATECTGKAVFTMTPGLSETPSSGTHNGRNGTEDCNGPLQGENPTGPIAVEWDGRYGTADPDTCSSGGEGWAVAYHYVPTANGTKIVRVIALIKYGGVSNGVLSGTFEGDYFSGTLRITKPVEGDCLTSPMTKTELTWAGTWHEYRGDKQ
jgi:hypothetical protein